MDRLDLLAHRRAFDFALGRPLRRNARGRAVEVPARPSSGAGAGGSLINLILTATEAAVVVTLLLVLALSAGRWRGNGATSVDIAGILADPETTGSVGWPLRSTVEDQPVGSAGCPPGH